MGFTGHYVFSIPESIPIIGGAQVSNSVTTTWIIMAFLVIFSIITTRNFQKIPSGVQNFIEMVVDGINGLTKTTMGPDKMKFASYMGTLTLYLAIANLIGLLGVRPPTADLNTTFALSIMTFIMIQGFGIRSNGLWKYLKGMAEPFIFMLPLNVIGELANPVSLAFRLFGNILGGVIIMYLLYQVAPILVPVVPHMYFDLFSGIIQTFIFVMLTMVFISMAMDD